MKILAIDPGTDHSGGVIYDSSARHVTEAFNELPNETVLGLIDGRAAVGDFDIAAIEMIACYGKRVGREVFETCVWSGGSRSALVLTGRC